VGLWGNSKGGMQRVKADERGDWDGTERVPIYKEESVGRA
jgi:hypothetical protein